MNPNLRNLVASGIAGAVLISPVALESRASRSPLEAIAAAQQEEPGLKASVPFNGMYAGESYQTQRLFSDAMVFTEKSDGKDPSLDYTITYYAKMNSQGRVSEMGALYTMFNKANPSVPLAQLKWKGTFDAQGKLALQDTQVKGSPENNQMPFYSTTTGNNILLKFQGWPADTVAKYAGHLAAQIASAGAGKPLKPMPADYDPIPLK